MDHQSPDKEKESDQMRECCGKRACEFNAGRNLFSDRLMPYGSRDTARDFEIYAADAFFEDSLMCAHGSSVNRVSSNIILRRLNPKGNTRYTDMISLIRLHWVDGKVIRHEDWWDKKPLKNRDSVDFPLVGRLIEAAHRGTMMITYAMMGFGKDPSA